MIKRIQGEIIIHLLVLLNFKFEFQKTVKKYLIKNFQFINISLSYLY